MAWELTDDLEGFITAAGGYLRSRPVEHTVLLTLVGALRRRGLSAYGREAPVFGTWLDPRGVVSGVLLQTPPHPVLFGEVPPQAVTEAVDAFGGRPLPGVNLPVSQLDLFVTPWCQRTGATAKVRMQTRLYRLSSLELPGGLPRAGATGDRERLEPPGGLTPPGVAADRQLLDSPGGVTPPRVAGDRERAESPGGVTPPRVAGDRERSEPPGGLTPAQVTGDRERLESLGGVTRPGVAGDRELLESWVRDFLADIGESVEDVAGVVDEALADDIVTIGLDSGRPASMVMRTVPVAGVVRIRYVFTPPALRGRGFAGAATAAACLAARRDGASEVVLFTDLANPTSNGLYQRLGFRPVHDRTVVTFE